jgi:hypothetical protein
MAKEELKWQNIDADDLPAAVKKSFDAMVEAEAAFKADLEKLLKNEGHMPEDKYLVMSRKGKRLGVAYASTPRGEGGAEVQNQMSVRQSLADVRITPEGGRPSAILLCSIRANRDRTQRSKIPCLSPRRSGRAAEVGLPLHS